METKMPKYQIVNELRAILAKLDCESDSLITREPSVKHEDEIELLIQHIRILVEELNHENQSLRNELFDVRKFLENDGGETQYGY
jgi:hypothetical protein